MDRGAGCNDVKEIVRVAVGRLEPDELPRFDEMWEAYLEDGRDAAHLLRSRDRALGAGIDVLTTVMTPLVTAITSEVLASLVKEPAAGAIRKVTRRLRSGRRGRAERLAALRGPAPDPAALEHSVMHALFMDVARRAGCTDKNAAQIADALVSAFTQTPDAGGAADPGAPGPPLEAP